MKSKNIVATIATVLAASLATADQFPQKPSSQSPQTGRQLSLQDKLDIANAIDVLVDDGVLEVNALQCLQFDGDIISQLKRMGLLNSADSHVLTVCVQGSAHLDAPKIPGLTRSEDSANKPNGNN